MTTSRDKEKDDAEYQRTCELQAKLDELIQQAVELIRTNVRDSDAFTITALVFAQKFITRAVNRWNKDFESEI